MKMNTKIPDRSQPGITMTAPTVRHRDVGDKYATGVPKIKKIRGRENIAIGTWNVRTLRPAGKLEQLTHAMSRYHWNIVGLCEMRWKNFGEVSTDDVHKVYFSGEEGKHEYGVGFLVHKDVVGAVLGCQPLSSRLISIRLRAAPFNITIIQVYVPRRHFCFVSSLLFLFSIARFIAVVSVLHVIQHRGHLFFNPTGRFAFWFVFYSFCFCCL